MTTASDTEAVMTRQSAFGALRSSPRLLVLMVALLPVSVSIGALGVARVAFATEAFGNELGIGVLAWVAGCAGAALAVPAGIMADRYDSRSLMVIATVVVGLGNLVLGVLLAVGGVQPWELAGAAMVDASALAFIPASLARTQAALTPVTARGSADVINLFRLSVGGVIGSLLTLWISDPAIIVTMSGVVALMTAAAIRLISTPVPGSGPAGPDRTSSAPRAPSPLAAVLRSPSPLRALVVADLCLFFIIPTQLVNLLLVDRGITEYAGPVIVASMVGVLVGRGWPALVGQPQSLRLAVTGTIATATVLLAVGALLMGSDWLLRQTVLFLVMVAVGSALTSFVQCILTAGIQQQVPDAIRGRLSGTLWAVRLVLISVSVAGSAYLVERFTTALYLGLLAGALAVTLAGSRGFRSLRS